MGEKRERPFDTIRLAMLGPGNSEGVEAERPFIGSG